MKKSQTAKITPPQLTIAVVGYGYWGQRLAAALNWAGVEAVIVDPHQSQTGSQDFPVQSWESVLANPSIQGVVIATPEKTHAELMLAAVRAGKAILVEKPAVTTQAEWKVVQQEATLRQLPILVDYTFLLSRAVEVWQEWQNQFASNLGPLQTLQSVRWSSLEPAKIHSKAIPVWLDTAIHDIYLVRWLWQGKLTGWQVDRKNVMVSLAQPVVAKLRAIISTTPASTSMLSQTPPSQIPPAQFLADYSWVAAEPRREWLATYDQGKIRWWRQAGQEYFQVTDQQGAILAETHFTDSQPSPLDRTVAVFLECVHRLVTKQKWPATVQTQWQKYWTEVGEDSKQLEAIKTAWLSSAKTQKTHTQIHPKI